MPSSNRIRAGVIGAGGLSQVAHIPHLLEEETVELIALCDLDAGRAATLADRFEIPKWYDQPEEMVKREKLDCVVVATPTISHLPLCQLCLESGIDVMVEKPFARNATEARRIVELAEQNSRVLMAGMNHRFREDTQHLKNLLDKEELGEIISVRAGWLKRIGVWGRPYWFTDPKLAGGGVLMDLGVQMLDLVLYLLGFPAVVEAVAATSYKVLDLDVEDSATAFIRLDDGITFTLELSWANVERGDVAYTYVCGSQGGASLNPLHLTHRQGNRVVEVKPPGLGDQVELYRRSFRFEIAHFIDCVQSRSAPLTTGREAVMVLDVVEQLYQSAGQ